MKRFRVKQMTMFPGTNTARSWKLRRPPQQAEAAFMRQIMDLARLLGLPCLHVSYYCGNKFYVKCSHCGHPELATCRKRNNTENAGLPDLCGIAWEIKTKRDRNQTGEPFEPSDRQTATHARLRAAGVPVLVVSPGNVQEAVDFLRNMQNENNIHLHS